MIEKWKQKIKCKILKRCLEQNDINKTQLQQIIQEGAILIDVRSPQEYKEEHINGAINIPLYEIKKQIKTKIPEPTQKIIVYCDKGGRSKKAQKELKKLGYQKIYNLYGRTRRITKITLLLNKNMVK